MEHFSYDSLSEEREFSRPGSDTPSNKRAFANTHLFSRFGHHARVRELSLLSRSASLPLPPYLSLPPLPALSLSLSLFSSPSSSVSASLPPSLPPSHRLSVSLDLILSLSLCMCVCCETQAGIGGILVIIFATLMTFIRSVSLSLPLSLSRTHTLAHTNHPDQDTRGQFMRRFIVEPLSY